MFWVAAIGISAVAILFARSYATLIGNVEAASLSTQVRVALFVVLALSTYLTMMQQE